MLTLHLASKDFLFNWNKIEYHSASMNSNQERANIKFTSDVNNIALLNID